MSMCAQDSHNAHIHDIAIAGIINTRTSGLLLAIYS